MSKQGPRQVPGTRKNENDPNRSAKSQIRAQQEQACHVLWGGHEQPPVQVGRKVKNSQARTGHQRGMGGRARGTDDDDTHERHTNTNKLTRHTASVAATHPELAYT